MAIKAHTVVQAAGVIPHIGKGHEHGTATESQPGVKLVTGPGGVSAAIPAAVCESFLNPLKFFAPDSGRPGDETTPGQAAGRHESGGSFMKFISMSYYKHRSI